MEKWPKQSEANAFYGNPRGRNGQLSEKWAKKNLVTLRPPFELRYAGKPVSSITIHRRCAPSLVRVFDAIWLSAGQRKATIEEWGVTTFGGSFNYRLKRKSKSLSMHAYGCAIDLSPERYPMGQSKKHFCPEVVKAFTDEGWVNLRDDPMHFQAALV